MPQEVGPVRYAPRLRTYIDAFQTLHNHVLNHVAVSVSDIEATVNWYSQVFGFKLLGNIYHIKRSETPDAAIFGIYPASLNEVRLAYMATGNGVGFEVFEFIDPKPNPQTEAFEYNRKGFFHVCVTHPNPDELADKVEAAGGKRIGKTVESDKGDMKCLYLSDPWGNVVEVLSVSFEWLGCRLAY